MKRPQGFSIIEFMIAITIGALLIASAGAVYLSNKTTYVIQSGLARLQENGRYADYIISRTLRMIGYQGCTNQKHITVTNWVKNVSNMINFDKPLVGFEGSSGTFSPALPTNLTSLPLAGTDVIEVRQASDTSVQLIDDMNRTNNPILVYDKLGIQAGETLFITNCLVGDVFKAGANSNATAITHTNNENTANDLSMPYTTRAMVMRFVYYAFYVKNTGRVNSNGEPIYALVRQNTNGSEDEIAEGVERMEILYGVDSDDDLTVDTYQTASEVEAANNWNKVTSLQIKLLIATTENVNTKVQPYVYNGAAITPNDRKLRREWDIFVNIRNRGLS